MGGIKEGRIGCYWDMRPAGPLSSSPLHLPLSPTVPHPLLHPLHSPAPPPPHHHFSRLPAPHPRARLPGGPLAPAAARRARGPAARRPADLLTRATPAPTPSPADERKE
ncbi:unnamed protein product [Closterium sp. NIES-54]